MRDDPVGLVRILPLPVIAALVDIIERGEHIMTRDATVHFRTTVDPAVSNCTQYQISTILARF